MSNVTLEIAGRKFTVACAAGEEAHIEDLGRIIDGKIKDIPGLASQSEALLAAAGVRKPQRGRVLEAALQDLRAREGQEQGVHAGRGRVLVAPTTHGDALVVDGEDLGSALKAVDHTDPHVVPRLHLEHLTQKQGAVIH